MLQKLPGDIGAGAGGKFAQLSQRFFGAETHFPSLRFTVLWARLGSCRRAAARKPGLGRNAGIGLARCSRRSAARRIINTHQKSAFLLLRGARSVLAAATNFSHARSGAGLGL